MDIESIIMKEGEKTLGRFHDMCHNKDRTDERKAQVSGSLSSAAPHHPKESGDGKRLALTEGR